MKRIDRIPAYETSTLNYIFTQIFSILETDRRRRRSDSRGRSDRGRRDDARKDDRKKNDEKKTGRKNTKTDLYPEQVVEHFGLTMLACL